MSEKEPLFPTIKRSIENFIEDEEGSIPAGKLLAIGTMILVMSSLLNTDAFAKHSSHSSHSSHVSGSGGHGSHASHSSHESHTSHQSYEHGSHASSTHNNTAHNNAPHSSHGSHSSHSNTAVHSNSNYSAYGDLDKPLAPSASQIPGLQSPADSTGGANIQLPELGKPVPTPATDLMPALSMPLETPKVSLSQDLNNLDSTNSKS